jgi:hypothetical protein
VELPRQLTSEATCRTRASAPSSRAGGASDRDRSGAAHGDQSGGD